MRPGLGPVVRSGRVRLALCGAALLAAWPFLGMEPPIQFADVTSQAGLRTPLAGIMGHAAAWGDIDGDGDLDLYVGGFADRPAAEYRPASGPVPNQLFRNDSSGRFEKVASPSVEMYARTSGAVFADLDNDGVLELYVANNARPASGFPPGVSRDAQLASSRLFQYHAGAFVDVSAKAGTCVSAPGSARGIGVFDYDADGLLDLLIVEDRFAPEPPRTRLCRNLGRLTFADVSAAAGIPNDLFGLGIATGDVNDDGRPDFFVSHSNRLFVSDGAGKYVEPPSLKAALAWIPQDDEDWPAGGMFADLNRDGRPDLIVGLHDDRARNRVYLNDGAGAGGVPVLRDVSADVGLPAQLATKSPHVEAQDFDNDGWVDLYFSAAWLDAARGVTPLVFRNVGLQHGLPRFVPLRQISAGRPNVYFPAGPSGDYDSDGRLDLFLANWFQGNESRMLRNISRPNGWLDVTVSGTKTINRMGIGSKVYVYKAGALNQQSGLLGFSEIATGYGFASGQAAVAHFGLGSEARVDVRVVFGDGSSKSLENVAGNRRVTVRGP